MNENNTKILGLPRTLAIGVAVLGVLALGYVGYLLLGSQDSKQRNAVAPETMVKVNDCINDRTAIINNRARSDSAYAADHDTLKSDVAAANQACLKEFGVKEAPPKTKTQLHDAKPLEEHLEEHHHTN